MLKQGCIALTGVIPLLYVQLYFSGNWYSIAHTYSLAMVFGSIGYSLFCISLILSTRIRVLDRLFGHDRVLRFHAVLAMYAILAGGIHYLLKEQYLEETTLQSTLGFICLMLFLTVMVITLVLMTHGFPVAIPFSSRLKKLAKERLSIDYSHLKLFHNISGIATGLVCIHVCMASSTQESLIRVSAMAALGTSAVLRQLYHKILRPYMNRKKGYTIASCEHLSEHIIRLTLTTRHASRFMYTPGQFCYLRIYSPVTGIEEHPFTLSSSPQDTSLQLTIKHLGNYTERLSGIAAGTPVALDGPYGGFTPDADERRKLFIAGGIGITPFLSILSFWQTCKKAPGTTLLWSVQREQDLIDIPRFNTLAAKHQWFTFMPILTREQSQQYTSGRITPELLNHVLPEETLHSTDVYICGPDAMNRFMVRDLRKRGLPAHHLHIEQFSI